MKEIGNQHGGIHGPGPGGEAIRSHAASEHFVIVPLPEDFDIGAVFQSEEEPPQARTAPLPAVRADRELSAPVDREPSAPVHVTHAEAVSLSIADLIDNHVRVEWPEAVAIAQHLCRIMSRDPAANLHRSLVATWNVEIMESGEVQVLPGGSSSDPLVKQVGRVLRALLLEDVIAPAELKLVASQASFDAPVYASLDELSAALRHFERPGEMEAIRAAFQRGVNAKFSAPVAHPSVVSIPGEQAIDESRNAKGESLALSVVPRTWALALSAIAAALVMLIAALLTLQRLPPAPVERLVVPEPLVQSPRVATRPSTPSETRVSVAEREAPPLAVPTPRAMATDVAPAAPRQRGTPPSLHIVSPAPPPQSRSVAPAPTRRSAASDPFEAERRVVGLLAAGRSDEAAVLLDTLVLKNPHYRLDPARASPEAVSALRNSKRVLLPVLARRHYEEAQAAFDAGDYSLAISKGERASGLLNDVDLGEDAAEFSVTVVNFLARASAARTLEEEAVYTADDPGVTPPRPLGRQLSSASLPHPPAPLTGRLEILVGRTGRVEAVRLETPANGYHDRMIVSAVKAWHYRPALRNGKPVRFNLVMSISLPDL